MSVCRSHLCSAAFALISCAGAVHAMPFGLFDPRSLAMGGTGVSSGTGGNASYFNPALLAAARPKDRFAFEMMLAARAADPDKLADDIDRMDSSGQSLTDALGQFNQAPTQTNAGTLANALSAFRGALQTVSDKTLEGNLFASPLTVGVPGKDLGWAIHAGARADFGAKLFFEGSDDALLTNFQTLAQNFAASGAPADLALLIAQFDTNNDGMLDDPNLQSHLDVRGAVFGEMGVSLAREFQTGSDNFAVGITPKYLKVYTFDYSVSPQRSEISKDNGRKDYTSGNLDIGVAKDLGSGFKGGLVVKNAIARTYTTVLGNSIEVKPQIRAGVSHHTGWTTVAIDLDLTENKPVAFDKPTRYAGIGAEFDVWGFLQLRAGYRADLSGNYNGVPSVGLGLWFFGLNLDLAVARRGEEDIAAALQLGIKF
jgi:hypothetical protein